MKKDCRFNIDFIEFCFLAEACIPPAPIARMSFWYDLIDEYYEILSEGERANLFWWMGKNSRFDNKNEDCKLFNARFDPNNQFKVLTNFNGEEKVVDCFKWKGKYYVKRNRFIADEYIVNKI